ncbi:MAG: BON domain-containing protein [Gammaproteobacteria bacterium]|nr:BON domain-containing protein [Gammaproteobacteria bacterium]MYE81797.1 BON domain-containing protein [Gammaproteobacteria bacterium]
MPSVRIADSRRLAVTLLRGLCVVAVLGAASCATITGSDPGARTPGVIFDDQGIEWAAGGAIREASEALRGSQIRVTSFNGVVLLTGLVPEASLKRAAQQAVEENVRKVRRIHNEIEVGPPVTNVSRINDRWLGTKVKTSLVASEEVDGDRVHVVTRDGVVYLMGLVSRAEGDSAADVARSVVGVQKVVKAFEYVDAG